MINIVLVNPEIPNNTGNIVRTCAATGAKLHIIEPCGFSWEDKYLKRSGLDYWEISDVNRYENMQAFLKANFGEAACLDENIASAVKNTKIKSGKQFFFASTKSDHNHTDVKYKEDCWVFFGRETKGLDEELLYENYGDCVRIPMRAEARSLNLANSVAIIIYEYHRQHDYKGLNEVGKLREFTIDKK
ncbi:MAG: tRNA (cytidine(34)-2'-O)-methyltransferase [Clostridia bacterium]|nr:tRNA (cytidine(34)-2'-O)-methyltransferase [Clostridia bacterium]MDE7329119.1 tRNA (cytidine(34)-2'-O)-methyltransferase [Clostridia bacterium]